MACSDLELKAIFSRSLESATALVSGAQQNIQHVDLYSEDAGPSKLFADLLRRDDIQAVIIALPIVSQPAYIKEALAAGKHVLSEKPIAKDMQTAKELLNFYKNGITSTWGVAENFRFYESFLYAQNEIKSLGKILGFSVKMFAMVKGGKYYETEWRKHPDYQGGFLLDGGIHFVAGMRLLLGQPAKLTALTAFTAQLQEHLPPVDTVNSIWMTESGVSGTMSVSFGTTLSGSEYTVACEDGSVTVSKDIVTVREGQQSVPTESGKRHQFSNDKRAVEIEVAAWAEGIAAGKLHQSQRPEEALADLEILEAMLRSGSNEGRLEKLHSQ